MARVEEPSSQLEVIAAAYIYNLVLAFVGVAIVFTAVGLYDTFHSPFAASNIKTPIAVSNLIAFLLTYFASLSWRASERAIERGRNAPQPKGGFYRLLSLLFVPSMIVCGAFSLIFLAGLFHTFGFATLLASFVTNSILLHVLFFKRSIRANDGSLVSGAR
jgi:ABC-type spermidine/putrescine transport system permease subunit II